MHNEGNVFSTIPNAESKYETFNIYVFDFLFACEALQYTVFRASHVQGLLSEVWVPGMLT